VNVTKQTVVRQSRRKRFAEGAARRLRARLRSLIGRGTRLPLGGALALAAVVLLVLARGGDARAQGVPGDRLLSAAEVVTAFQGAGLPVEDTRQDPLGSSPSGPPSAEREAWSFAVPSVAPSGGRILVFEDDRKLQVKGAWFRRSGATVAVHRNVILWLDPAIDPSEAARYRQALRQVR
jgi:hypothetical protein